MNNETSVDAGHDGSGNRDEVILMVFRIVVLVIGLFGNILVIFVILVLKEYKKSVTHWYILQLAIADSIFLMNIPFKIVEDIKDEWIFSSSLCKIKETVLFLNYYSSILFLMVMSIDRYIAVCHTFSSCSRKLRTRQSAYIITVVIWMASLLMCIPIMLYSDKRGIEPNCRCQYVFPKSIEEICKLDGAWDNITLREECIKEKSETTHEPNCVKFDWDYESDDYEYYNGSYEYNGYEYDEDWYAMEDDPDSNVSEDTYERGCHYVTSGRAWSSYLTFNFVVMFIVPFLVMSVCYSLIAVRLRQSTTNSSNSSVSEATVGLQCGGDINEQVAREQPVSLVKMENSRIRITVTCFILVLLFLVCWLPFHAVHIAKMHGIPGKPSQYCAWLGMIASLFGYLNSAINPYVYNFIGTKFGNRLRMAMGVITKSVKRQATSCSSDRGIVRNSRRLRSTEGTVLHSNGPVTAVVHINGKENVEMEQLEPTNCELGGDEESSFKEPLVHKT